MAALRLLQANAQEWQLEGGWDRGCGWRTAVGTQHLPSQLCMEYKQHGGKGAAGESPEESVEGLQLEGLLGQSLRL